jgi:hypothetical protein
MLLSILWYLPSDFFLVFWSRHKFIIWRLEEFIVVFWTTSVFHCKPCQVLKSVERFGKDLSCWHQSKEGKCSISWKVGLISTFYMACCWKLKLEIVLLPQNLRRWATKFCYTVKIAVPYVYATWIDRFITWNVKQVRTLVLDSVLWYGCSLKVCFMFSFT